MAGKRGTSRNVCSESRIIANELKLLTIVVVFFFHKGYSPSAFSPFPLFLFHFVFFTITIT